MAGFVHHKLILILLGYNGLIVFDFSEYLISMLSILSVSLVF